MFSSWFSRGRMRAFVVNKLASLFVVGLLAGLTLASNARAQLTWVGATGNWNSVFNWNPSGPPNVSTNVAVNNGGTVQVTMAGSQGRLIFLGQDVTPFGTDTGHMEVLAAPAALRAGPIYVGHSSDGTLYITSGGSLTNFGSSQIGAQSFVDGEATVTGTASLWQCNDSITVGESGRGTLHVLDGGTFSTPSVSIARTGGSYGVVNVGGEDSTLECTGNLVVGTRDDGQLNVTQDGDVTSVDGFVGRFAEDGTRGVGAVTVDGMGSTWRNSGELFVGDQGTGTLSVANRGNVSAGDATIGNAFGGVGAVTVNGEDSTLSSKGAMIVGSGGTGALNVLNGGSVSNEFFGTIGSGLSSMGSATVDGSDSSWINGGALTVGVNGRGTLKVSNGGLVTSTAAAIGQGSTAAKLFPDTATIEGMDLEGVQSTWSITGALHLGLGAKGWGELIIKDGGLVSNTDSFIGSAANNTGAVTVAGANSFWANSGGLNVGNDGVGSLLIKDGGRVSNAGANISRFATPGFMSTVTVDGDGSEWMSTGGVAVGTRGVGELTILNAGKASSGESFVGSLAGAIGTVEVSGERSRWNQADLNVGYAGAGQMNLLSGGDASTANQAYIGRFVGSTGIVSVGGDGSTWSVGGRLSIGGDAFTGTAGGTGLLEITSSGRVDVGQDITLFSGDIVILAGGTLAAKTINPSSGVFSWTSGKLHVDTFNGHLSNPGGTLAPGRSPGSTPAAGSTTVAGDYSQVGTGILDIEIGGLSAGSSYDQVNVTHFATLGGALQVTLIGGFVPSPSDVFTVLDSTLLTGAFSSVPSGGKLTTTNGSGSFVVHYGASSPFDPDQVILSDFLPSRPGDFDLDGDIDGIDFLAWQRGLGTVGSATVFDGDANGDGNVDAADLAIWKSNYATASAVATTVPEPTGGVFCCFAVLVGLNSSVRSAWRE